MMPNRRGEEVEVTHHDGQVVDRVKVQQTRRRDLHTVLMEQFCFVGIG
jgi:hypothetical protein